MHVNVPFCVTRTYMSLHLGRFNASTDALSYVTTYQTVVFSLLLLVGIAANLIVIVVILKQKDSMKSLTNCLLINLATSDLFFFATYVPSCILQSYGIFQKFIH